MWKFFGADPLLSWRWRLFFGLLDGRVSRQSGRWNLMGNGDDGASCGNKWKWKSMSHQESLSSSSSSSSSSPPTLWHPLHQVSNLCRLIHHQPPIRCKAPAVATHWLWTNLKAALVRTKSTIGGTCCGDSENCTLRLPQLWHSWRVNQNKWNLNTRIQFESDGRCKDCGKRVLCQCTFMEYVSHFHAAYQTEPVKYMYYASWENEITGIKVHDIWWTSETNVMPIPGKFGRTELWQKWAKYLPQSLSTRTFEKKSIKRSPNNPANKVALDQAAPSRLVF